MERDGEWEKATQPVEAPAGVAPGALAADATVPLDARGLADDGAPDVLDDAPNQPSVKSLSRRSRELPVMSDSPAAEGEEGAAEHTVMLDPVMQDRLMALRAQQDAELRQRFGGDVTVMFTDLVGSTAYYEKYGDLMGRQKMLTHNALLFPIIRAHQGTIIKTIGDAIMCCFDDVDAGLGAAERMQQALKSFNAGCGESDEQIHIRIGLNRGPAIAEDGDLHGDAVNVAARVESKADGDEILVSQVVREAAGSGDFVLKGRLALRGKAERLALYRLRWDDSQPIRRDAVDRTVGGRFRLRGTIGRGPDGVVYAAEDTQLGTAVALKLLHDFVLDSPEIAEMVRQRFVAVAPLRHDHLVRLLGFSPADADEAYYVMDRVDGPDLASKISREGAMEPARAAQIVAEVARAVAHAHGHAVVHGNIKPENIFVRADGRALLGDFGLAVTLPARGTVTQASVASPAFRAPEQITGDPITPATDVYALGAVLYYLVSGRPPFEPTASLDNMRAVAAGQYLRLSSVRAGLPRPIVDIVEGAMATRPEGRFGSIDAMIARLEDFVGLAERMRQVDVDTAPADAVAETLPMSLADMPDSPFGSTEVTLPAMTPLPTQVRSLQRALIAVSVMAVLLLVSATLLLVVVWRQPGHAPEPRINVIHPQELPEESPPPPPQAPTPKAAAPAPTPPPLGQMILNTQPWPADVYIDNAKVGRTPELKELQLPVGVHQLRVVHPKRQPYLEQIEIEADATVNRRIKLKPAK